ncbi:hypothetical protein RFI_28617 [Reticulomyxa filosa]|uniref:Uncharacterized protein n=1 Tax=Reticulomyxa filosa TaxID=46433 RepID=X6M6W6_RETFI|nr:hypothetical protein RFI_28617 [Reticulomyxa filosa]|eukprot:ETO08770.1 hypothetical protein RFI_28617 [Reticulomyxa filosa]
MIVQVVHFHYITSEKAYLTKQKKSFSIVFVHVIVLNHIDIVQNKMIKYLIETLKQQYKVYFMYKNIKSLIKKLNIKQKKLNKENIMKITFITNTVVCKKHFNKKNVAFLVFDLYIFITYKNRQFSSKGDLFDEFIKHLYYIEGDLCDMLIASIAKRIHDLINANGNFTKCLCIYKIIFNLPLFNENTSQILKKQSFFWLYSFCKLLHYDVEKIFKLD